MTEIDWVAESVSSSGVILLEFLGVDLLLTTKPILVEVAYRPSKDNSFYNKLENILTNSPIFIQQETYILGDLNTNVLAKKNSLKIVLNHSYTCLICVS